MLEANESLENIFEHAVKEAEKRRHEYVTIEHLLLALIKDQEVGTVLAELKTNVSAMILDIENYLDTKCADIVSKSTSPVSPRKTASLERLMNRAFTQALFQGRAGDPVEISAAMDKITESREATQPIKSRTGGSTFKNPPGNKSWQLIDKAGMRGFAVGPAKVSDLHCNFLINEGGATAAQIEGLGETVRAKVKATSGIELDWEIKRIGLKPEGAA